MHSQDDFQGRDIFFNGLVLEIIDRCTARCAMCYQAAGPRGSDIRGDGHLKLSTVRSIIDQAAELNELGDQIHVGGGEAFIAYNDLLSIFSYAQLRGFRKIGTVSNGFWATTPEVAIRKCEQLAISGMTYIDVSLDYWHLPYVSFRRIRNLASAARRIGLVVHVRTLSSRAHKMAELFSEFSDAELVGLNIANGPVLPIGRGAREIPIEEVYMGGGPEGCCETALNLTVTPNGNVYPCCAGADMTNSLACGNVNTDSLQHILLRMKSDKLIRNIIHAGTGELVPIIKLLGYEDRLLPQYADICHLCWDVFKDDELADALRNYFENPAFRLETLMTLFANTT